MTAMPSARAAAGGAIRHRAAVKQHLSTVTSESSTYDLDEGRLAGSVFSEQGMNFTRTQREVNLINRSHTRNRRLTPRSSRISSNGSISQALQDLGHAAWHHARGPGS